MPGSRALLILSLLAFLLGVAACTDSTQPPAPAGPSPARPAGGETKPARSPDEPASRPPGSPPAVSSPAPVRPAAQSPEPAGVVRSPSPSPESPPAARLESLSVRLVPVVDGLRQPIHVTHSGDGSGRIFISEKAGRIRIFQRGQLLPDPFLDISDRVGSSGNEQGLFSAVFHPRFPEDRRFFVNYTNRDGDSVIESYEASDDPSRADPASAREILTVDQPFGNHNGGQNQFGPDGYLYIGLGDGGAGGDPQGNGQDLPALLGKILRLDIDGGSPYAIPPDNPFTGRPDARPEIWAYGLRNPWRFSFDAANGDLYLGDVGQGSWEEIDWQPASSQGGENYGWNIMEGAHCFRSSQCDTSGLTLPVAEYPLENGNCAVSAGHVYHGSQEPRLQGIYFYADYCSGRIWGLARTADGTWQERQILQTDIRPSSFGTDEANELYLTDLGGGVVYRLAAG